MHHNKKKIKEQDNKYNISGQLPQLLPTTNNTQAHVNPQLPTNVVNNGTQFYQQNTNQSILQPPFNNNKNNNQYQYANNTHPPSVGNISNSVSLNTTGNPHWNTTTLNMPMPLLPLPCQSLNVNKQTVTQTASAPSTQANCSVATQSQQNPSLVQPSFNQQLNNMTLFPPLQPQNTLCQPQVSQQVFTEKKNTNKKRTRPILNLRY